VHEFCKALRRFGPKFNNNIHALSLYFVFGNFTRTHKADACRPL
jgi:hypothetical protein